MDSAREPVPADLLSALPATAAEPVAEPAAEAPAAAPAAPAEPEMIEVWRPHRHQGGRRPEPARGAREGTPGERQPGGRRGDRPNRGPRPGGPRREGEAPVPAQAASGDAAAATPRPEREPRRDDRRQDRRDDRRGQRPDGPRPEGGRPEQAVARGPISSATDAPVAAASAATTAAASASSSRRARGRPIASPIRIRPSPSWRLSRPRWKAARADAMPGRP